jgi:hypothetical protein
LPTLAYSQNTTANDGGDLAFGGAGSAPGRFLEMRDLTFDRKGRLYVLDGARYDGKTKARIGNLRVQIFTDEGKLPRTIDLRDEATGAKLDTKNDPQRIAVDDADNVYVTQPIAGLVQTFGSDGKFLRAIELPGAMAITAWNDKIVVLPSLRAVIQGKWADVGGDRLVVLGPKGTIERTIPLQIETPLKHALDMTVDRADNFYIQAEPNAIYVFSAEGKKRRMLGGNPTTRIEDGSELLHTVAVDSKGNLYTYTWGNPGRVTRYDAGGKTITQRGGEFQWADPWSVHSAYTILAIDPKDRLWVGVTGVQNPAGPHYKTQRAVPAVVRAKADFFENPAGAVRTLPVRGIGFRSSLACSLPQNVGYEPNREVTMTYKVSAANRSVHHVTVDWHAYDADKQPVGNGSFAFDLEDGKESMKAFGFTPPRFGAYFVVAEAQSADGDLEAVGEHVGITPHYDNMDLPPGAKGGWVDPARQMWTGLPLVRLHPAKDWDKFDQELALCEKYGAVPLVQWIDNLKNHKPEDVARFIERFKGRIQYLEVCNEPNFSGNADQYFAVHKQVYEAAKKIDPKVEVMGPATVNMELGWLRRLYELGFKDVCDIVSLHDYEGHESISPEHWKWKLGEVRKIMNWYGDGKKPIWQTERAIAGVRGADFMGLSQAIRTTLHRDLLETLGIPGEHNAHYYLNQGGYSSVPSYVWSQNGPHPAALALRTRYALTTRGGRHFTEALDFGPNGNSLYLGAVYAGPKGSIISLRNLGTRPTPIRFAVEGQGAPILYDTWGNFRPLPVKDGSALVTLEQLPVYVSLTPGLHLAAPKLDFGKNLAAEATFAYSSTFKGEFAWLNNGVIETYHAGNPKGDTNGKRIWTGDLPGGPANSPQTLEWTFRSPQKVNRVVVRGVRPDNAFCALLAYDLQYRDGADWKTIERVDHVLPASMAAKTADAVGVTWVDDTNFYVNEFPPVAATRMRLVVRNTSYGFLADDRVRAWGNLIPQKLMLREIEAYGPR